MKCLGWFVLCAVLLVVIGVDRSGAFPRGCLNCAKHRGFPSEKCCDECPVCRHNFDVEAIPDPGCRKPTKYQYDVEKVTGCHKETYDRLDAAFEVLPQKGCKKSYQFHYDVEKPCDCYEENYDTHDFEVIAPKKETKCSKVKLEAYADHPVRDCQCDCNQRRYVQEIAFRNQTLSSISENRNPTELDGADRNRIVRLKRHVMVDLKMEAPEESNTTPDRHGGRIGASKRLDRPRVRPNVPNQRRELSGPRMKRREKHGFRTIQGGFVCHCKPADQSDHKLEDNGELVGGAKKTTPYREPAVYIGDSANPITYDQIKKHMDALPRTEYSPTTNDIISNLTVLFYDIYQQKHKKNFTLPLKYGTRTVVDKGDGLQQYDIKPIEGEYQPPKLNRIASKGLRIIGRKIDRKTGQEVPRKNRLRRRP